MNVDPSMSRHLVAVLTLLAASACATTSHPRHPSALGASKAMQELLAVIDQPGTVELETVVAADWVVPRKGLLDLEHPAAVAAGLKDGLEPIQVHFHAIRHPTRGLFLVDTGVERALRDRPPEAAFRGVVASEMHLAALEIRMPLADWLAAMGVAPAGVLLTHLHPDHLTGMADVPPGTAVYVGPREAGERGLLQLVLQPNVDRALRGKAPLSILPFTSESGEEEAVDVFGDGAVWALWLPGHTSGNLSYLVRTPRGPVLLAGDTCPSRWGWEHAVPAGEFSDDVELAAKSLARLRRLVAEHPGVEVRFGHQP